MLSSKSEYGIEQNQFLKLTNGSRFVYLAMAMEAGGKREFEFTRMSAQKYGISNSSLRVAVHELVEAGMIKKQSGKNARIANKYEFLLAWKKPP